MPTHSELREDIRLLSDALDAKDREIDDLRAEVEMLTNVTGQLDCELEALERLYRDLHRAAKAMFDRRREAIGVPMDDEEGFVNALISHGESVNAVESALAALDAAGVKAEDNSSD